MGIGTSLGAYFETQLDHHAGNEYLLNPNSTPDNNELSTNEVMPKPDEEPKITQVGLWKDLTKEEKEDLEKNSAKIFPDHYSNEDDIKNLIYKYKAIETYPDNLIMKKFLDNVPQDMEIFDYMDNPDRTKIIRLKEIPMSYNPNKSLVTLVSDIKTASPFVTITDKDIDKGVNLGLSFSGGGLTTTGKVLPMRKAANDNKKLQIDDPVMDAGIQASWDRMVRGQQIVADRQTLINTQSERALNDIEKARLNKLDKEHAKHFGNYYPD